MFRIHSDGESYVMLFDKGLKLRRISAIQGHANNDEPLALKLRVKLFQRGPLLCAVGSPGGPEVEQNEIAAIVTQPELLPARRDCRPIGGV